MKLVRYHCETCGADLEEMYLDSETVPRHVRCHCARDVYAVKRNWKDNGQRVRIFDKKEEK